MPPTDATTAGQLVILAGLIITALTQVALAYINRREIAAKAVALEAKVETTAATLAVETARRQAQTEDAIRRAGDEIRAEAAKAYGAANNVNEKLARMAGDLDARFDKLLREK